jgi:hypothetical protein
MGSGRTGALGAMVRRQPLGFVRRVEKLKSEDVCAGDEVQSGDAMLSLVSCDASSRQQQGHANV